MHKYKELKVWVKAMEVVERTYDVYRKLPDAERFNFGSQITRCALSVPSNIAEGAGRNTKKDFSRFLDMAAGSAFELETQLILINRIFKIETEDLLEQVIEVQKMLYSLKGSMKLDKVLNT